MTKGKRNRSIEAIKEAIEKDQDKIIAPVVIEKAIASYQEADHDLAKKLFQANEAFETNDLREAENLAIEAIMQNKRCAQAYLIIGKIAFFRGQFEDAKEAYTTAIKCNRGLGEAYFGLGRTELRDENFSKALDNLQKAIVLEKGHADWYAELGRAYMGVRQYSKAAKVLKRASSLEMDNKEYRDLLIEAEEKQRTHSFYTRGK